MGRGGKGYSEQSMFSWEEIKSHDSNNDRWIVIGGQVYDVTDWSRRHPGGSRMLGLYGGQDATVSCQEITKIRPCNIQIFPYL